ncbi:hypothetical protein, partial [Alteromonas australica]|uniref:hypothetical protein n=1 Tax=Alteromonas australica TaxID=589873 RepID=UPI002352C547
FSGFNLIVYAGFVALSLVVSAFNVLFLQTFNSSVCFWVVRMNLKLKTKSRHHLCIIHKNCSTT